LFYQDDQISFFPAPLAGWVAAVGKRVREKRGKRDKSGVFVWLEVWAHGIDADLGGLLSVELLIFLDRVVAGIPGLKRETWDPHRLLTQKSGVDGWLRGGQQ
jgi:hypothetical protein